MSVSNRVNEVIPQEVIDDVTKKLNDCRVALAPYMIGLTENERQSLFKQGDKTVATVQKVSMYLGTNPELAPSYMDQVAFAKDEIIVTALMPLHNMANQLAVDLDDTRLLAGSEALAEAMFYYGSSREAAGKGVVQAKPIYDDLKTRFTFRKGVSTLTPPPAE